MYKDESEFSEKWKLLNKGLAVVDLKNLLIKS